MKKNETRFRIAAVGSALAVAFAALLASAAPGTYYTTDDNENNAGTHAADGDMDTGAGIGRSDPRAPIEFNIQVTSLPDSTAVLTIYAFDVDEESGETDDVYFNGQYLGRLTGANQVWSTTAFTVDPSFVVAGDNLVVVDIDTSGDPTNWIVNVDWGQLLIDGGAADQGNLASIEITDYAIAGNTVTIDTAATIHSITGGDYRLEVAVIDPLGNASSVLTQQFALPANADTVVTASPTYPLNGVTGTYTIQAQLFWLDPNAGNFPVQQDIATAMFVHTQGQGPTDLDNDGLTNDEEDALGTDPLDPDTDGDGAADGVEVGDPNAPADSDGDGKIDALESSLADADGDGTNDQADADDADVCVPDAQAAACLASDTDGDGLTNEQEDELGTSRDDADTDGDGIDDGAEVGGDPDAPADSDGDGLIDALESGSNDADGDGLADSADADSDNDGIPDSVEFGANPGSPADSDGDGTPDYLDRDSDGDGIPDALEAAPSPGAPPDSDGDGLADFLDVDSDDDGLPDRLEGGVSGTDTDADGIDDAFDVDQQGGLDANLDGITDGLAPPDADGDGAADYRSIDSDSDGILDTAEGDATGIDSDGDGIDDAMDVDATGGTDADGDGIDDGYALPDTDGDGVPDMRDLDADNDSVPDVTEAGLADADGNGLADPGHTKVSSPPDSDADGAADYRDVDSDGDGTSDIVENGQGGADGDGDGRVDDPSDADGDGLADVVDGAPDDFGAGGADSDGDGVPDAADLDLDNDGIPNEADGTEDVDGDGLPNFADRDSDGDGLTDTLEAGGVDADGDGVIDDFTDANGNGLADDVEPGVGGTALPLPDTDEDGAADYVDVDSDADGIADVIEAGGSDADDDGRVDDPSDADGDGLADAVDGDVPGSNPLDQVDSDDDGLPDQRDTDSDGDGVDDGTEGTGDSDGDGIPDYRDAPGRLETAVGGAGATDGIGGLALLVLLVLARCRRLPVRRSALVLALLGVGILSPPRPALAEATADSRPWYLGADFGRSQLEPRNRDGGYRVDDDSSEGFRLAIGRALNTRWAIEAFYLDAGEAGIASDNDAVGHLGNIRYRLYGAGAEWTPWGERRWAGFYPALKIGLAHTDNSVDDDRIDYERQHDVSVYFGAAAAWEFHPRWRAQLEVTSYDEDELFVGLGLRWNFAGR